MSLSSVLNGFAAEYQPKHGGFAPDVNTLGNGNYDFEIVKATADKTKNGDDIFKVQMRVLPGSNEVQKSYWFNGQGDVNRLGADLMALGLETGTIDDLGKTLDGIEGGKINLVGVRFRGSKDSYENKDKKTVHTFKVMSKLNGGSTHKAPPAATAPPSNSVPF